MTQLREDDARHGFATRAVHAGQAPDPLSGAVMTPIYQTSTYVQEGLGRHKGYEYARTQNPTREALERCVASLEGGTHGFAFGSGLAALDTILKLLSSGDHVVCGENVYGGSHRLMERVYGRFGLTFTFVDMRDPDRVASAITPATRLVYGETPTNPMMFLADLEAIGHITQARGLLFAVDNTFATPYFQQPLALGADLVLHSTTKYLNGHSDMVGGMLVTARDDLAERIGFLQNAAGGVPGPMDCWLCLRGLKTLPLRMRQHDANGRELAAWLVKHPQVRKVYYPGLPDHPQHALACRQMRGFGGVMAVQVRGGYRETEQVMKRLRLFAQAVSLGGVESLAVHAAAMWAGTLDDASLLAAGIEPNLIRLSIGLENPADLIADLAQAMAVAG